LADDLRDIVEYRRHGGEVVAAARPAVAEHNWYASAF
jgi:hypothetical protein